MNIEDIKKSEEIKEKFFLLVPYLKEAVDPTIIKEFEELDERVIAYYDCNDDGEEVFFIELEDDELIGWFMVDEHFNEVK